MIDRREAILSRIVEVIEATSEFAVVSRNKPNAGEGRMPEAVVFDADEESAVMPDTSRWREADAPQLMTMRPEIYVLIAANAANAGPRLSELRAAVYRAIVEDKELSDLVGRTGRIIMQACRSQFAVGRTMQAELRIEFAITYVLWARDLV
jgi:molybdenum cofactor biosynthesis enzyme